MHCPECGYEGLERYCPICQEKGRVLRLRGSIIPPLEKDSASPIEVPISAPSQPNPEQFKRDLVASARKTSNFWFIYSGASLEASGRGQRPTQMAFELAKTGTVLFTSKWEPLEEHESLFRCTPSQFAEFSPKIDIPTRFNPIGIVAYPDKLGLSLAKTIQEKGWLLTYDCIDFWPGFTESLNIDFNDEAILVRLAKVIIVSAKRLEDWVRWLGAKEVIYLPNAATWEVREPHPKVPPDLKKGTLTLLYSGHLSGSWINQDLIQAIVKYGQPKGWRFNLVGDLPPHRIPGAFYLGPKPYRELGPYLTHADVGIIPFKENILTECVSPLKVFDYLSAGLPVVSSFMPELAGMPYCHLATPEDFCKIIEVAAKEKRNPCTIAEFRQENSWAERIRVLRRATRQARAPIQEQAEKATNPILLAMEERIQAGLYRPEFTTHRMAWWCGTSCGYKCPYCQVIFGSTVKKCPYTTEEQLSAWERWTSTHGPTQITASGLEALHSPDTRGVLARLSQSNILDINTNLAFSIEDLSEFLPTNVLLSASFHPSGRVSLLRFLNKLDAIQHKGFHVTGISCVLYPPLLKQVVRYKEEIRAAGHYFLAHPFQGNYQNKIYPESYSDEELQVVRELLENDSWEYNIEAKSTFGRLCWTGSKYGLIDYNGFLQRCPFTPPLDNFFESAIELKTWPEPCTAQAGCHCNDLWRYLLTDEEVRALTKETTQCSIGQI